MNSTAITADQIRIGDVLLTGGRRVTFVRPTGSGGADITTVDADNVEVTYRQPGWLPVRITNR